MLGGPQGGALVGRAEAIEKARRDPLARALRLGRLPLVALEATVALYLEGRLDEVPALAALRRPLDEVRARAEAWARRARGARRRGERGRPHRRGGRRRAGRGAGPLRGRGDRRGTRRPSRPRLREGDPPVVGRIHEGRLLLDARTVLPGEDDALVAALVAALG